MPIKVGVANIFWIIYILSSTTVRGENGVAGEGKLVGVPKLHSWVMLLMNSPTLSLALLYDCRSFNLHFGV